MSPEIDCAGERLVLLPEKAIVWPRTASLIVADLHLGKPAAFRVSGIPVPEATTAHDLGRLDRLVDAHRIERLIILGDFFHSAAGRQAEMMDAVADWCARNSALEIILIPGNHDEHSGAPPETWRIRSVAGFWSVPPFSFCHEPRAVAGTYSLCGHLHPSISLREKFGSGLRLPCFWFGNDQAVLPAFGSFTGTKSIRPRAGDRVFAVGEDEVVEVLAPRPSMVADGN